MTLLDASAVIAFFRQEPAADEVEGILQRPTWISSINLAEVRDKQARHEGTSEDAIRQGLSELLTNGCRVIPVTAELGLRAGALRAKHYDAKSRSVSLADCVAAAAALHHQLPLATSDAALADVVRDEGGTVVVLPDSSGLRPEPT